MVDGGRHLTNETSFDNIVVGGYVVFALLDPSKDLVLHLESL